MDARILGVVNGSNTDEVIEVVCERGKTGEHVQLRLCRWGPGIGWYPEKTLDIDASQVDHVIQALQRAGRRSKTSLPEKARSVVVPFARRYGT